MTKVILFMIAMSSSAAFADSSATGQAQVATESSNQDSSTAGTSMAMAGALAASCNKPQGNVSPCIMSALSMAQGLASSSASNGAANNASDNSVSAATNYQTVNAANGGSSSAAASVKSALASAGATVAPDNSSVTLPNGTTVPLNASSGSDAGMAAAGLTSDQIAQGHAALEEAKAKVAAAMKTSTPNGESGSSNAIVKSGGAYSPNYGSAKTAKVARAKPNLSGLTKNLGNDKIGVSADDIFEMVTRRYQARDANGTFIKK